MREVYFGVVGLEVFAVPLVLVLALYAVAQWPQRKESSFFTWAFLWRIFLPASLTGGLFFIAGFAVGDFRTSDSGLNAFFTGLMLVAMLCLGMMSYLLVQHVHGLASRALRLSGAHPAHVARA